MAARDSEHDVERGFGTGLRAQLGKRVQAETVALAPEPDDPTDEADTLDPTPTVNAAADREELNEERAALDVRAQGLVDTKQELDAREARMAEREADLAKARAELEQREEAMLREVKQREQGLEERGRSIDELEQALTAHRREIESNAGRKSVELLAEREAI